MSQTLIKRLPATAAAFALMTSAIIATAVAAQDASGDGTTPDPQATADTIGKEVAQIRGLPFKHPVGAETQSAQEFSKYVQRQIDAEVPPSVRQHYGLIVKTLGLYRGPVIDDFNAMMTSVMVSQAGAYYDPQKQRFYMLMNRMPEMMRDALYSHELYHALQDQYFDLSRYMGWGQGSPGLNSDQKLARAAVVEGEATYMMTLWMFQKMMNGAPPREALATAVEMQAGMGIEQIRAMLQKPQMGELVGEDIQAALESTDKIPAFILEEMVGAYLKGMGFVFAVQEQGWPMVEKLYREYPPQSTEHVLHPEKWLAREAAVGIEWPDLGKVAELRDWELLDSDVLGEFRWRSVFKEYGLASEAESAAAGWGGDRYAVFKRKGSDATLLLLSTAWDSKKDAEEFAGAYRRVLKMKYAGAPVASQIVEDGTDVLVVEGGDEADTGSLMETVKRARKR